MPSEKIVLNRFVKNKKKSGFKLNIAIITTYFKTAVFGCLFGLVLGFTLKELFYSSRFAIKSVTIYGMERFVNETDLYKIVSSNVKGKNIFTLNKNKLIDIILKNFLGIKTISIEKHLPATIQVYIKERVPLAVIYSDISANNYLVDEDGYILGLVSEEYTELPRIQYDAEIKIGTFINKSIVPFYNTLMSIINERELKVSSMSFSSKNTKIFLNNGIEILISQDKDLKNSIETAIDVLVHETSSGKTVKGIDLRYDKVIVSY